MMKFQTLEAQHGEIKESVVLKGTLAIQCSIHYQESVTKQRSILQRNQIRENSLQIGPQVNYNLNL